MKKIILIILSVVFMISCSSGSSEFKVDPVKGTKFPSFTLKSVDGKETFNSSDVLKKDKKTLFIIAAEWCPHCRNEAIELQKFYEEHKDAANIVVVYSANNSSPEIVAEYLAKNKYTFPAYYDYNDVFLSGTVIQGFPFNLIIDKDGKVSEVVEGELTYDILVEKLTK